MLNVTLRSKRCMLQFYNYRYFFCCFCFNVLSNFTFSPLFNRCFSCGLNCFSFCSDSAWALKAPKLEKTSAILKSVDVVFSLKLLIKVPIFKKLSYIFIMKYKNECWLNYIFDIIHTNPL